MMLFDTSIIIEMLRKNIYKPGAISIISLIEILRGVAKQKREAVKEVLENAFEIIAIDNDIILTYCDLYNHLKDKGELLSDADLLIAASAIAKRQKLITKDTDFRRLKKYGLSLSYEL